MNEFLEIFKYILPSTVVALTSYFIFKKFLDREYSKTLLEIRMNNQKMITPIKLQAYERLKKNQHTFSPLLNQLAVGPATKLNTAASGDPSVTATANKAVKGASKAPQEVRVGAVAIKMKEAKEDYEVKQSREGKPPATGAAPAPAATPASDLPSPPPDRPTAMGSAPITGAHNSSSDQTSRL